jgi:hypothetical protein
MSFPIQSETVVFSISITPPVGEPRIENINITASETDVRSKLTQKVADIIADLFGYDDPTELESRIQLSHRGIILGQNDCETIKNLRALPSHEHAGKTRTSAIYIKILPE